MSKKGDLKSLTRRDFLKLAGATGVSIAGLNIAGFGRAAQRPTIRVLTFAQGFAWPELFGTTGTEKTELLKEFEEKEEVNIAIEWGDETTVRQKVATDLAAGTGRYDILLAGSAAGIQTYGAGGFLEPLDKYMVQEPTEYFDPRDVYQKYLDANRMPPEGPLYGLPYYSFGAGVMYRKDIFDKYGVKPPKTSDELYDVLGKLQEGLAQDGKTNVYPITMRCAPGEEPTLDLTGFVYAWAGYPAWFEGGVITQEEIKQNKAKPIFTGDFAPGFNAYCNISKEYGPPGIASHTWVDMRNLYAADKAVILMPSAINAYAALSITENPDVKKSTRFAKIPTGPSGEQIQSFWTMSLGINRDSKNKTKAWRVLNFLTGKESMLAFAERTKWPNVTMKSALYSDALLNEYGEEQIRLNEESILEAEPYYFPYVPELAEFAEEIGTKCSEVVSEAKTSEEALGELQGWATQRMLRAGYY